jgi:hypothetical protein
MSSLLEQAIVDATALRQAAIKSAEKDLVEKYSHQIKEAVDKLLEQEEQAEPVEPKEDPMDAASALENTPSDLSSKKEKSRIEKDLVEKTPDSYMTDDDKQMIEIDFSELKKQTPEIEQEEEPAMQTGGGMLPMTSMPAMGAAPTGIPTPAAPALAESMSYDVDEDENADEGDQDLEEGEGYYSPEALDEDEMFEFYEKDLDEAGAGFGEGPEFIEPAGYEEGQEEYDENLAALMNDGAVDPEPDADVSEDLLVSMDEEGEEQDEDMMVNFGEEEQDEVSMEPQYGELEEETTVEVDTKNVPTGHRGVTTKETREAVANELAHRKDDKYKEELKHLQDAVEESDKQIAKTKKRNEELKKENLDLKNMLGSLKEHIERMNLSNAKLLYTNRVLENISLNERQKKMIVESIAKTETVETAKIAFETLQSAVEGAKIEVKAPKSLNEAVSRSGASPFLVRSRTSQEASPQSERMKILAGINKK